MASDYAGNREVEVGTNESSKLVHAVNHGGQSNLGPRGNRVQEGALGLIDRSSPLGAPTKANPLGASRHG